MAETRQLGHVGHPKAITRNESAGEGLISLQFSSVGRLSGESYRGKAAFSEGGYEKRACTCLTAVPEVGTREDSLQEPAAKLTSPAPKPWKRVPGPEQPGGDSSSISGKPLGSVRISHRQIMAQQAVLVSSSCRAPNKKNQVLCAALQEVPSVRQKA